MHQKHRGYASFAELLAVTKGSKKVFKDMDMGVRVLLMRLLMRLVSTLEPSHILPQLILLRLCSHICLLSHFLHWLPFYTQHIHLLLSPGTFQE